MVHTLEPWTSKWRMATIFGQIDSGELAARLGSPVTFDRRGNVIWMDDFEGATLLWNTLAVGDNSGVHLVTTLPFSGSQCCILTAGEGGAGRAKIWKYFPALVKGKTGIEFSFTINPDTDILQLYQDYYDGTKLRRSVIRYDHVNSKVTYRNWENINKDLITDFSLKDTDSTWHTMKLVVDILKGYYTRLILNDIEIDMSSYLTYNPGSDIRRVADIEFQHWSSHASAKSVYIDKVIFTQNEP